MFPNQSNLRETFWLYTMALESAKPGNWSAEFAKELTENRACERATPSFLQIQFGIPVPALFTFIEECAS